MAERVICMASPELSSMAAVARQCAELGRLEEARLLPEGLIVLEPEVAYLRSALGCVLMQSRRDEEALFAVRGRRCVSTPQPWPRTPKPASCS